MKEAQLSTETIKFLLHLSAYVLFSHGIKESGRFLAHSAGAQIKEAKERHGRRLNVTISSKNKWLSSISSSSKKDIVNFALMDLSNVNRRQKVCECGRADGDHSVCVHTRSRTNRGPTSVVADAYVEQSARCVDM